MVLKPGREAAAEAIFRKWELDFAVIGQVTDTGRMVADAGTARRSPTSRSARSPTRRRSTTGRMCRRRRAAPLGPIAPESSDIGDDLLQLMGSPDLASRRWIWEQYDHMVGADTVQRPGGDAAMVRIHGSAQGRWRSRPIARRAIAMPIRSRAASRRSPNAGAISDRGRREAAGRDRLPELRQSAAARDHGPVRRLHRGHGRGLPALAFPIVRGNVSLYNETKATTAPAARSCRRRRSAASA